MLLTDIKGIGEKRAACLAGMGILTPFDLVTYFPSRYVEFTGDGNIAETANGDFCSVTAAVESVPEEFTSRKGMRYSTCLLSSNGVVFKGVWFNNRYIKSSLTAGKPYIFSGKVQADGRTVSMINPAFKPAEDGGGLRAVYSLPPEISQGVFSDAVSRCLGNIKIEGVIDPSFGLLDINSALRAVHFPRGYAAVSAASSRLAVEELVQLILALRFYSSSRRSQKAARYSLGGDAIGGYLRRLPFSLTDAQNSAISALIERMRRDEPMNALLQGDVGSGKTAVAFALMEYAAKNGYQSALMAPTEVLAKQHFENASKMLSKDVGVRLITGSTSVAERREIAESTASGAVKALIGTHAVFQKDMVYKNLALVVTDEQHRFGVRQRAALEDKGACPDVLVMSATPIPRTMSLIVYGDLDVVTLDAKPGGRVPPVTAVVRNEKLPAMLEYIAGQVRQGHRAYIVCPSVFETEEGAHSVEGVVKELRSGAFSGMNVACVHGRMSADKKDEQMRAFASGQAGILVATTVIEVGVDVREADIIAVLDADRFGLSSLHQLRGRVGRGGGESRCFLHTAADKPETLARLKFLCDSDSGFDIADKDFELRGSGDFFGDRQSGFVNPVFKRIKPDGKAVRQAREIADRVNMPREEFIFRAYPEYADIARVVL